MVAWVEFIGEIAEKITERRLNGRIVGSLDEDDGIRVGIENPLTKMIEGAVEMESGMAGGETGHEDVEIGRIGFAVLVYLVMDFDPFFGDVAERNVWLQSALRSFAIVCDYMETALFASVCDLRSAIRDRLRSFAIIWKPALS